MPLIEMLDMLDELFAQRLSGSAQWERPSFSSSIRCWSCLPRRWRLRRRWAGMLAGDWHSAWWTVGRVGWVLRVWLVATKGGGLLLGWAGEGVDQRAEAGKDQDDDEPAPRLRFRAADECADPGDGADDACDYQDDDAEPGEDRQRVTRSERAVLAAERVGGAVVGCLDDSRHNHAAADEADDEADDPEDEDGLPLHRYCPLEGGS